jgi:hypothetical protein
LATSGLLRSSQGALHLPPLTTEVEPLRQTVPKFQTNVVSTVKARELNRMISNKDNPF